MEEQKVIYDFDPEHCVVREYDIASLDDSRSNHFSRMEGEKWDEFVGSIRQFGIVSPLIVRPKAGSDGRFEILAGHNRRSGAEAAGLKTVPCITVNVDDVDASVLIGITNEQREEVSDLEWGWTFRTTLETLKQQRKAEGRKDADRANAGGTNVGERSVDIVARKFGVNRKTVRRKIRLTYLVPQLYELGKKKQYSQKMMIDLSYLPPEIQTNVVQAVVIEEADLTEAAVAKLRAAAAEGEPGINEVLRICRGQGSDQAEKGSGRRPVKYEVPEALFPKGLNKGKRQEYITAALEYIRDQRIDLDVV